jgi:Tol biopolymer transport system component
MTQANSVQEIVHLAEELYNRGEKRQAAILVDKILKVDFTNVQAWQLVYRMNASTELFEVFQRTFAERYYPSRAHLLEGFRPVQLSEEAIPSALPEETVPQTEPMPDSLPQPTDLEKRAPVQPDTAPAPQPVFPPQEDPRPTPKAPPLPPPPPVLVPRVDLTPTPRVQQAPPQEDERGYGSHRITCLNCGRINPPDARMCAYCGHPFYAPSAPRPAEQDEKPKPRTNFRLNFVDLGDFVVVASLLLPWAKIFHNTFIGNSSDIYNAFGVMAEFTGNANINIAVILFFLLALAASILVRARLKLLGILSAAAALAAQVYTLITIQNLAGQASGDAGLFFDLSSLEVREGVVVGLIGAILILLGVVFYKGEGDGGISLFIKKIWKGCLAVTVILFLLGGGIIAFSVLREQVQTGQHSTQSAMTNIPMIQTSFMKTETVLAPTPRAGTELRDYQIVYVGPNYDIGADTSVWVANGDGSDQRRVYESEMELFGAYFLPDRRSVIFYGRGRKSDKEEIWTVDTDGNHPRKLVEGTKPQLSPDGRYLTYYYDGSTWLYNLDGSTPRRLGQGIYYAWLPDSRSLLFGGKELGRINIDSSEETQFPSTSDTAKYYPIWTADANVILFQSDCGQSILCLFRLDTSTGVEKQLTQPEDGYIGRPTISPDGKWVAWVVPALENKPASLYVMNITSADMVKIATDVKLDYPTWSPDGKWLLYSTLEKLFVVQPGGTPQWIRLTSEALAASFAP